MAQQLHTTTADATFLVVLFFLSYVLSSAPKYVRGVNDEPAPAAVHKTSVFSVIKKTSGYYSVTPYKKAVKIMKNAFLPD